MLKRISYNEHIAIRLDVVLVNDSYDVNLKEVRPHISKLYDDFIYHTQNPSGEEEVEKFIK